VDVLNPRAARSKAALESAILGLVATNDLGQITISDITKQAGVNRSTFYEHYADVHELAASACMVGFDASLAATPMVDPSVAGSEAPANNPLVALFAHFGAHAQLYRSLLGPDGSARVINHLLDRMRIGTYINRRIEAAGTSTHADDPSDVPYDPEASVIAGALLGTVIDWLQHGCPCTPEKLASEVWPPVLRAASVRGWAESPPTH
jgi:AcrR family transcriptional regulator